MRTGSYLGEFFSAIKQVLTPDLSRSSGVLVRIPRRNWMHLFPWLRLYYCPQSKTTRLYSRAKVDVAREGFAIRQPERFRNLASKACTQPSLEESSAGKEIPTPREKILFTESRNPHLEGRQNASPPEPWKQRRAMRRARASSLRGKRPGPDGKTYVSTAPGTDGQIHVVVRVELAGLAPGISLQRSMTNVTT
ncbi:hypothetical protein NU688_08945 [Variovorax sp. ZS18.2.2]|uniref:hypothetical protein n=1 Tax=Variovorax sp. ZS18.2.2 TaxID=2971255 RepID=UPI002151CAC4|nr:hypothetical protein [Variovorax sp. ZS18.2.2]MCR6476280.1 hypothetical protein [Variovorax sp. ZS18.2.2]